MMKRNTLARILLLSFFILPIVFFSVRCSNGSQENLQENNEKAHAEEAEGHKDESKEHSEVVTLSEKELKEFGIELATVGPGRLQRHIDLTGEIVVDPNRLAHIIPRFPGIVKQVNKRIGDEVEKDDVLAVIESNESLTPYEVRSLIKGTVIDMHLTRGEMIADQGHAFTVADLSEVWANLNLYQKDLPFVRVGQRAIVSAGPGLATGEGRISYISPIVNEQTRTATARVILKNPDGAWKPGLFVTAQVIVGNDEVPVYVPKTALQTFENKIVVFVREEEGFVPAAVQVGRSNSKGVEIVAGLEPGQVYAAKGGFTLKAELQKEAFGEGHGH